VSICSPNYLHDAHIRFALRNGADAICEKPLVLNPWNIDALKALEEETGKKAYNILQLRLHPTIQDLKKEIHESQSNQKYHIDLSYITSRGRWYFVSWKGNEEKSGGIATNIGIHFFDMLIWIFGRVVHKEVHVLTPKKVAGFLELERANVRWFLSVDRGDLPESALQENKPAFRSIRIDGEEFEFSGGFTDLHTKSYDEILNGNGFGMEEARSSISLVSELRNIKPVSRESNMVHPFAR
jgi:UDP-N-acetyl-2-amino-2-deoxyglucuronate dehydrogenase